MDFEAGLWMALRDVFPHAQLRGCGFHWAQAIHRHVQSVGLATTYQRREGAHQLIRKLLALPFLPGQDIARAFDKLHERAPATPQMQELFTYVKEQWMSSSLWSTNEWSVYRQDVRTNNDTEDWHRRLNMKAGRGNLQMYVLLSALKTEALLVSVTMQLVGEGQEGRRRRPIYERMDEELNALWDAYDGREIVTEDFLNEVGKIYGER